MWMEPGPTLGAGGGVLAELLAIELLGWVLSQTLTQPEALSVIGEASDDSPHSWHERVALIVWSNPGSWSRCRRAVRAALAAHRTTGLGPGGTLDERAGPSVDEVWALLEEERAHSRATGTHNEAPACNGRNSECT